MIRSYEKYKRIDGYEYIEFLPQDWDLLPNKAIFEERVSRGHINEELLSVTIGKGIIKQTQVANKKDNSNEDKSSYKLSKIGDIVYNKMRMWQGSVGHSPYRGIVSPAYVVLKPKSNIYSRYYHYLFRSKYYSNYSKRFSYGLCDDQLNLRYSDFKNMYSIVPPIETQISIANYLDLKSQQLDKYKVSMEYAKKLLLEKINSTVFGIDKKTVADKDLDWQELFNDEWKFVKASRIFTEINIKNKINEKLLSVTQDRGVIFKDDAKENFVSPTEYKNLKLVEKENFVISLRSFQGGIELSEIRGIVSPAYNVFKFNKGFYDTGLLIYYKYLFKTPQFITLLNTIIVGIRDGKNISYKDFSTLYLPIPDELTMKKITRLDEIFNRFKKDLNEEIERMDEYLESLTFNVVTGKIKID